MTFAMSYAYSENYILVLSHDEVVHLKCSMLNKMPGIGADKYSNLKAGYAFMMGHAGKKLLFMGQEFAQLREWSEERELDWYLLAEEEHLKMQNWVRDLLHLYKRNKAMYEHCLLYTSRPGAPKKAAAVKSQAARRAAVAADSAAAAVKAVAEKAKTDEEEAEKEPEEVEGDTPVSYTHLKAADSLSPDHVKEMLEGKKQKKRLRPYQVTALAAACLAVVIAGAVWGSRDGTPDKSKPSGSRSSRCV